MSEKNSYRTNVTPGTFIKHPNHLIRNLDPVEELYNLINVNKKPYLVQNDFINFFESRDFPNGMDTFDTSKYFNFVEGGTNRVVKYSISVALR